MTTQITKAQFDALAVTYSTIDERDVEYSYTCVVDRDGAELAFATYRTGQDATYTLRETPFLPLPE